jgi:hypothetical protein
MPIDPAAAPEAVLDALDTLGQVEGYDSEEYDAGESQTDSEEFAAPEEVEGEEADQEPEETDEPEEESPDEVEQEEEVEAEATVEPTNRVRALAQEAKRAQRFRPILEMLEEDPTLAREIVGRKLGLVPAGEVQPRQVQLERQPQAPQWTEEQKSAYWNKRMQENPAAAIAELLDIKLGAANQANRAAAEPSAIASYKSVVRSFKADLVSGPQADEQWEYYEPYFDALLKNADRNFVMSDPDTALTALRDLAYGKWANEQRTRRAKAMRGTSQRTRENPRQAALAQSSGGGGRRVVKQTRALNADERMLAERYGLDLVTPDEDEPESAWR